MPRALPMFFLLLATLGLAACGSTTFISTWKSPEAQAIDPSGERVAAVFITRDESSRREAEDILAAKLNAEGASGIASYTLVPSDILDDMDEVKSRLRNAGVSGVLTLRVIDESRETVVDYDRIRPGFAPYYWNFTGYWGYGWGAAYVPTNVRTNTVLRIETLVYSLERDALLWAGTSRTVNPDRISEFVPEVAETAARQMMRQGVLAKRDERSRSESRVATP